MLNSLVQMKLKLLHNKRFRKAAEETGDSFRNKIADRIKRTSNSSPKSNSEKIKNK